VKELTWGYLTSGPLLRGSWHGSDKKYLKLPYPGKIQVAAAGVTGHNLLYHYRFPEEVC